MTYIFEIYWRYIFESVPGRFVTLAKAIIVAVALIVMPCIATGASLYATLNLVYLALILILGAEAVELASAMIAYALDEAILHTRAHIAKIRYERSSKR